MLINVLINLGNTKYITATSVGLNKKTFSRDGGGLSGKGSLQHTLKNVELIASNFDIPIIATGGISNYENVRLALKKGATCRYGKSVSDRSISDSSN